MAQSMESFLVNLIVRRRSCSSFLRHEEVVSLVANPLIMNVPQRPLTLSV